METFGGAVQGFPVEPCARQGFPVAATRKGFPVDAMTKVAPSLPRNQTGSHKKSRDRKRFPRRRRESPSADHPADGATFGAKTGTDLFLPTAKAETPQPFQKVSPSRPCGDGTTFSDSRTGATFPIRGPCQPFQMFPRWTRADGATFLHFPGFLRKRLRRRADPQK